MTEPAEKPYPGYYAKVAPHPPEGDIDLVALAADRRPIELEIGFGRGMFLIERAAQVPQGLIVGIEVKPKWAYKVHQRCTQLGLNQVLVWAGDARETLPRLGPDGCLERLFMHFPDPWWKKRHAKRRLLDEALLTQAARLLRAGGELFVQTDVEARAEGYRSQLSEHADFELAGGEGWLDHNPYGARSNREKRAAEDGLPVHRLLAYRR